MGLKFNAPVRVIERADSKFNDIYESETPVSIGTFLEDNSELLSLVGVFSVAAAALPQFLSAGSREFALGAGGAILTLLVTLSVLIFRLVIQVVHAFSEYRFIRLSQHFLLTMGLLLLSGSLGFAIWQYRTYLFVYGDLYVFGVLLFVIVGVWFNTDQINPIGAICLSLSAFTQLIFGGFFSQYEFYRIPVLNEPSYTIIFLSTILNMILLATAYYLLVRVSIRSFAALRHVVNRYS